MAETRRRSRVPICIIDGCTHVVHGERRCKEHFEQCHFPGCSNQKSAELWCEEHYRKFSNARRKALYKIVRFPWNFCIFNGCIDAHYAERWCEEHYYGWVERKEFAEYGAEYQKIADEYGKKREAVRTLPREPINPFQVIGLYAIAIVIGGVMLAAPLATINLILRAAGLPHLFPHATWPAYIPPVLVTGVFIWLILEKRMK